MEEAGRKKVHLAVAVPDLQERPHPAPDPVVQGAGVRSLGRPAVHPESWRSYARALEPLPTAPVPLSCGDGAGHHHRQRGPGRGRNHHLLGGRGAVRLHAPLVAPLHRAGLGGDPGDGDADGGGDGSGSGRSHPRAFWAAHHSPVHGDPGGSEPGQHGLGVRGGRRQP